MNKTIYKSGSEVAEKEYGGLAEKAISHPAKPNVTLALTVAALCGYIVSATPVHAIINVPTDTTASPLCIPSALPSGEPTVSADGQPNALCTTPALPFTAKMLIMEEFGNKPMPTAESVSSLTSGLPAVADCPDVPDGTALDSFLSEDIHPFPTEQANHLMPNAWANRIRTCGLLSETASGVLEGRPGGEQFAHQRWNEFFPQTYFQSATTGARVNNGLRDSSQMHNYSVGEFGPDGLYYPPGGTNAGVEVRLHHNLPVQAPNSVWTFDGTFPPKVLMARYGKPILFRHYNALPIDVAANGGFGIHTLTTHEHNGHQGAENDGYAHAFFYPGQFFDYHWPMILAGHDSINTGASDPRTGSPDGNGGINYIRGDWRETMSTHWFHDHMQDFTAQNVYKGSVAMMNYYSAVDRGREPKTLVEAGAWNSANHGYACHYKNANAVNLCLPSGTGLDWGNRDYDVDLLIADKAWDNDGQLKYNIFNTDGFLGDRITVNWVYKPYLDVRARRYRFRMMNGSISRFYKIAIVDELGKVVPSYMIANDGNIMQHAVKFPNLASAQSALPEQSTAERYDIIIDFKNYVGKKLYMVNILEHDNGRGPTRVIPLKSVLNGTYKPNGVLGDPGVGKFLEFRVKGCGPDGTALCTDLSMNPANYVEGKKQMIPLNKPTTEELQAAVHRTFEFGRYQGTDGKPWTIRTDHGDGLNTDPNLISAQPSLPATQNQPGKVEIWHLSTPGGWSHPVHVHFEEGQILKRGGVAPPLWEKYARKDVYRIGDLPDSTTSVDIAIRFREFAGTYMEHCHNTQHEDKAMLLRWDLRRPGETLALPTPEPGWEGVTYSPSTTLPTYIIGDLTAKATFVLP